MVIFPAEGAAPYLRDLPKAEVNMLDAGHFALENERAGNCAKIRTFLDRSLSN